MKYSLDDIIKKYEKRQGLIIKDVLKEIYKLFDGSLDEIAFYSAKRRLIHNRFIPPDVRAMIERVSNTVNAKTQQVIINGIKLSWITAEQKNAEIENMVYGGRRKPPGGIQTKVPVAPGGRRKPVYTSVDAFIKRKNEGLGLSKRIWKLSNSYKSTLYKTVVQGLKDGVSARAMAKDLRGNLRENDVVKNPGRGIYRSPRKNAERLTRSEINMAYGYADNVRWQQQWFVIGIEVRLSRQHPKYDICDPLAGKYPKDFVFAKWHPQCLCNAVPILASQEQRDKMMDFQLGITDKKPTIKYITSIPSSASGWISDNSSRIKKWKSQPYWKRDNPKYVGKYFP